MLDVIQYIAMAIGGLTLIARALDGIAKITKWKGDDIIALKILNVCQKLSAIIKPIANLEKQRR